MKRAVSVIAVVLAGCAGNSAHTPTRAPEAIQADIAALIPSSVAQRSAWAVDLQ